MNNYYFPTVSCLRSGAQVLFARVQTGLQFDVDADTNSDFKKRFAGNLYNHEKYPCLLFHFVVFTLKLDIWVTYPKDN